MFGTTGLASAITWLRFWILRESPLEGDLQGVEVWLLPVRSAFLSRPGRVEGYDD